MIYDCAFVSLLRTKARSLAVNRWCSLSITKATTNQALKKNRNERQKTNGREILFHLLLPCQVHMYFEKSSYCIKVDWCSRKLSCFSLGHIGYAMVLPRKPLHLAVTPALLIICPGICAA